MASKAKIMQIASEQAAGLERLVRVTARKNQGQEYHLLLPESVVRGIVDGDTPDVRIRVPIPRELAGSVRYRYVLASIFEEIDIHDEMSFVEEKTIDE